MNRHRIRRLALVLVAIAAGLVLGVGVDIARTGGLDAWLARGGVAPTYEARGRMVEVDGRAVYLDCRGAGSPTVILEAGFGGGADGWGPMFDGVAAFARTCAWDRPGIGRSAPRGLHSGAATAADLRAALAAAGEHGPFIVVAHSLGGVYARLFVASPGERVERLLMLDTYEPDLGMDLDPALDAEFRALIRESLADGGEMFRQGEALDWQATLAELATLSPPGSRPPTLLLYTDPNTRYADPDPAAQRVKVDAWYRAIAARYPEGVVEIVPGASHFIHLDRPGLVTDRIRSMVDEVRAGAAR